MKPPHIGPSLFLVLPFALLTAFNSEPTFDSVPVLSHTPTEVQINFDGKSKKIITKATYVIEAVKESGVPFDDGDSTEPFMNTPVTEGVTIEILRGKPVIIYDEGRVVYGVSGYTDNRKVLKQLGRETLDADIVEEEIISPSREKFRLGKLIKVTRAPRVKVIREGKETVFGSWEKTVGELFEKRNIVLEGKDYAKPTTYYPIEDGMTVMIYTVREFNETKRIETPYKTITSSETKFGSASDCRTRVTQVGQNGIKDTTYFVRTENGVEVKRKTEKVDVIQPLKNHLIVKDRIISTSSRSGAANSGRIYSGYTTAYHYAVADFGGWPHYLGKKLLVTNLEPGKNYGKQVVVTIVSPGPDGKILDLSHAAYRALGGRIDLNNLSNVKVQKILCEA